MENMVAHRNLGRSGLPPGEQMVPAPPADTMTCYQSYDIPDKHHISHIYLPLSRLVLSDEGGTGHPLVVGLDPEPLCSYCHVVLVGPEVLWTPQRPALQRE